MAIKISVAPAKAGAQKSYKLDSRLRGNDKKHHFILQEAT
jgi:hypothetical protein